MCDCVVLVDQFAMAKSLRSKWKRKMKAQKRVRYGEKERARLEKMLKDFKESEGEKKKEEAEEHSPQVLGKGEVKKIKRVLPRPIIRGQIEANLSCKC